MAKLEQGILGPFRGKVGSVVGYLWRGRQVMRAYRKEINYPNTERQQAQRTWFVAMVRFAATARQALLLGMREKAAAAQMTEGNLFVKMNKHCFGMHPTPQNHGGEVEGETIDYEHLTFSHGPVARVDGGAWTLAADGVLTARWERRTPLPRCKSNDEVHLYLYNARTGEGILAAAARRGEGTLRLSLPDHWQQADLHCYLFATDAQGHASPTAYAPAASTAHTAPITDLHTLARQPENLPLDSNPPAHRPTALAAPPHQTPPDHRQEWRGLNGNKLDIYRKPDPQD